MVCIEILVSCVQMVIALYDCYSEIRLAFNLCMLPDENNIIDFQNLCLKCLLHIIAQFWYIKLSSILIKLSVGQMSLA